MIVRAASANDAVAIATLLNAFLARTAFWHGWTTMRLFSSPKKLARLWVWRRLGGSVTL